MDIIPDESVVQLARTLETKGIKPMDALHMASAIEAKARFLLTTDNALIHKTTDEMRIQVMDPVDFVRIKAVELQ